MSSDNTKDNDNTSIVGVLFTNNIVDTLLKNYVDHDIDGVVFNYIGKGGEGIVYKFTDPIDKTQNVAKIYTTNDMNSIMKEFYVVGVLQELRYVNRNVVKVHDYYLSLKRPVLVMEMMDGTLSEWADEMLQNKNNLSIDQLNTLWLSMIFQVTYGILFLNRLNILHNDTKSKNILYRDHNKEQTSEYVIEGVKYMIPSRYQFKIADFGAIQIIGSSLNKLTDEEIKKQIQQRQDLYELSRLLYRVLVNYGKNYYGWDQINPLMNSNTRYKKYHDDEKRNIDKTLGHMPYKIKNNMLLRSMIYYGIENDIIDKEEIIKKYSLHMPSKRVWDILDKLVDLNVKNVFTLFDEFMV